MREDPLGVDVDDWVVRDEHLLLLDRGRLAVGPARVKQPSGDRVDLILVVGDCKRDVGWE